MGKGGVSEKARKHASIDHNTQQPQGQLNSLEGLLAALSYGYVTPRRNSGIHRSSIGVPHHTFDLSCKDNFLGILRLICHRH